MRIKTATSMPKSRKPCGPGSLSKDSHPPTNSATIIADGETTEDPADRLPVVVHMDRMDRHPATNLRHQATPDRLKGGTIATHHSGDVAP